MVLPKRAGGDNRRHDLVEKHVTKVCDIWILFVSQGTDEDYCRLAGWHIAKVVFQVLTVHLLIMAQVLVLELARTSNQVNTVG